MAITPNPIDFSIALSTFLETYGVQLDNEKSRNTVNPHAWDWGNLIDCFVQTQWEHNRAEPGTLKGNSGPTRDQTQDIEVTGGLGLSGGQLFSTLFSEQFDAGGLIEGVTGFQFDQAAGFTCDNSQAPIARVSLNLSASHVRDAGVVIDDNLAAQAANAFTDGTESIAGRNWTVGTSSAAQTWGLDGSTGWQWAPANGGSGKTFSELVQTAAYAYITLGDLLGSAFDPSARWCFEIVYSINIIAAEATRLYFGLWAPSNSPTGLAVRLRLAAVQTHTGPIPTPGILRNGTSINANTNVDLTGQNTMGLIVESQGVTTVTSGVYSGGWPRCEPVHHINNQETNSPFLRSDTRLVVSSNANAATPALSAWTISRMRVRRL